MEINAVTRWVRGALKVLIFAAVIYACFNMLGYLFFIGMMYSAFSSSL